MTENEKACSKKVLLIGKYADAAHLFSRATELLFASAGNPSAFRATRQKADSAHDKCNAARLVLDTHSGKHGC